MPLLFQKEHPKEHPKKDSKKDPKEHPKECSQEHPKECPQEDPQEDSQEDPQKDPQENPREEGIGSVKVLVNVIMGSTVIPKWADVLRKKMSHSKELVKGMEESFCYFLL